MKTKKKNFEKGTGTIIGVVITVIGLIILFIDYQTRPSGDPLIIAAEKSSTKVFFMVLGYVLFFVGLIVAATTYFISSKQTKKVKNTIKSELSSQAKDFFKQS